MKPKKQFPSVQQITARVGPTVEAGGETYRLGFNDQDAKARLEELIRGAVVRAAVREKRALGGADGEEYFDAVQDRIDAGYYATFGRGWSKALASADGVAIFLLSLLQEHHPDMTADRAAALLADEPEQCKAALRAVTPDFFKAVLKQRGVKDGPALDAAIAEIVGSLDATTTPEPATAGA